MDYFVLKWIHIVSSTLLFGTGLGTVFYKCMADYYGNVEHQAQTLKAVVWADMLFTAPAVVVQLVTGLWMAHLAGYALFEGWLLWVLCLFVVVGCCWLPVLWLQVKMRDLAIIAAANNTPLSSDYYRYRKIWLALGVPAFIAVMLIFWLMVFKPI